MPDLPRSPVLRWSYLGRVGYATGLEIQRAVREAVLRGEARDTLLLLEHPPVITLGRSANSAHVLASADELRRRGVEVARTERGGDVTYHGPGQLVGYPIRRIGRGVVPHVQGMARAVTGLLEEHGLKGWWRDDHPGIWTEAGKIAAVGVDARGGVTTHGFALNVKVDLDHFALIVPCGYLAPVASMSGLLPPGTGLDLAALAHRLAHLLAQAYGAELEVVAPSRLGYL